VVDTRTLQERALGRKNAIKLAQEEKNRKAREAKALEQKQDLAIRESDRVTLQIKKDQELIASQAELKKLQVKELIETNKATVLKVQAEMVSAEHIYQSNRRQELDRLQDTNWIEARRHGRTIELENLKKSIRELEIEQQELENAASKHDFEAMQDILKNM